MRDSRAAEYETDAQSEGAMKECPNPDCIAQQEQWQFWDNERVCSRCGTRLISSNATPPTLAAEDEMERVPAGYAATYTDEYGAAEYVGEDDPYTEEAVAQPGSKVGTLVLLLIVTALVLLAYFLFNQQYKGAQTEREREAQQNANATATALATLTVLGPAGQVGTATPGGLPTVVGGGLPTVVGGGLPTVVNLGAVATVAPLAISANGLIYKVELVKSCRPGDTASQVTSYSSGEDFFVLVEAKFGRDAVNELHTVWQGPPGFNTTYPAANGGLSFDGPTAKLVRAGTYYACFQAAKKGDWLVGDYRVYIYANNGPNPVEIRNFSVFGVRQ